MSPVTLLLVVGPPRRAQWPGDEEDADVGPLPGSRARGTATVTAWPFRRVLVGWDGSADAAEALSVATSAAGGEDGHVVVLAVVPQAWHVEAADDDAGRVSARRRVEEGVERARRAIPSGRGARLDVAIIEDTQAGPAVCAYAEEHGFDLVVLGRHGDGGELRPGLGRVAEAAARAGRVPVLLVSSPAR